MIKKILVTGGAGYVGSKISLDLIKQGYKVYVVDNLSRGSLSLLSKKVIFYKCNIGNKKKINYILEKNNIKSVIHCAAFIRVQESEKYPKKYFINNVVNTKKLLEVCAKNHITNFIFSSTANVYGEVNGKVNENTPAKPVSVYGKTKLNCEKMIKKFSKQYKFNYGILRYFNIAGSDIKNKIGIIKKNDHLFKNLAQSIVKNINKISIYGNDYTTQDGTCIRDYIYLNDLSLFHIKLLKLINKKNKSFLFNCGYGVGYSVYEIIEKFEQVFKMKFKKIYLPRRKGDAESVIADTKKINRLFKLSINKKNKIRKIIRSCVEWERYLYEK